MNTPTRISFRNMDRSPAVTERIEHEMQKLRRHVPGLGHCEVMVEALHRHHRSGHHYQVHLTLRLPGAEVDVSHESPARRAIVASATPEQPAKRNEVEEDHDDVYVVVRDAFDVARRRLEHVVRRARDRSRASAATHLPRNAEPPSEDSGMFVAP